MHKYVTVYNMHTDVYACISVCSVWQEGLLPQLLQERGQAGRGGGRREGRGGRWVVLDGALTEPQLDTLLTLLDPDQLIKLSNGRILPTDPTCKIILEVRSALMYCTYI